MISEPLKEIRSLNRFKWVPLHIRTPFPPKPADNRMAIFWLARKGDAIWFVNESDEMLDYIKVYTGGYITLGEHLVGGVATVSGKDRIFKRVLIGEAIQIDEFDGNLDSDYCLSVRVELSSPSYPKLILQTDTTKGGVPETVLLWNTGESGKRIGYKIGGCNLKSP